MVGRDTLPTGRALSTETMNLQPGPLPPVFSPGVTPFFRSHAGSVPGLEMLWLPGSHPTRWSSGSFLHRSGDCPGAAHPPWSAGQLRTPAPGREGAGGTVLGDLQKKRLFAWPEKGAGTRSPPRSGLKQSEGACPVCSEPYQMGMAAPGQMSRPLTVVQEPAGPLPRTPAGTQIPQPPQAYFNLGPLWHGGWRGPHGPGKVPSLLPLPGGHPGWEVVVKTLPPTPSTVPLEFPSAWGATSWPLLRALALN